MQVKKKKVNKQRSTSLDVETGDSAVLGKEVFKIPGAGVGGKSSQEQGHGDVNVWGGVKGVKDACSL